jgi:hypothetical protein
LSAKYVAGSVMSLINGIIASITNGEGALDLGLFSTGSLSDSSTWTKLVYAMDKTASVAGVETQARN